MIKCRIIQKEDFAIAKFSGSIKKNIPFLIKSIVNTQFHGRPLKVILDLENLDESSNVATQLFMIITFKKEMDMMNGSLKICSLQPGIKNYLIKNRLDQVFDIYEDLGSSENSPWRKK